MSKKVVYKIQENRFSFFKKIDVLSILMLITFLITFFLFYKLYEVQVINGEKYDQIVIAQNKGVFLSSVKNRGNIYLRLKDEKVGGAVQKFGYILAIEPNKIKEDKETIYKKLSSVLEIDKEKLFKILKKTNDPYEELKKKVTEEQGQKILALHIKGVYLDKYSWRVYPFKKKASEVIGFLNYEDKGVYGLEKYYNSVLERSDKVESNGIFNLFFHKKNFKHYFNQKKISKEGDLNSTIDIEVSDFLVKVLEGIDKKYNSAYSGGIILKPATGEVIAMADTKYKNLDFNSTRKHYKNILVQNKYEFGSIMKPLTVAIGLETKSIDENFTYFDKGCEKISGYKVCNFDSRPRGENTTLQTLLTQSLNMGSVAVERKIGHKNFLKFLIDADLETETNIDLSHEASPSIGSLNYFADINFATASFGQGISFTPIAMIRNLSSLANGGYLVKPHLIEEINYGHLIPEDKFEIQKKKIFSVKTTNILTKFLVNRADKVDKKYKNPNYAVATKTGTAQISSKKGGYLKKKVLHTMFGFFPAEGKIEDRYAILIFTYEPKGVRFSVGTMRQPFYDIVNFLISYYNVVPDRPNISFELKEDRS